LETIRRSDTFIVSGEGICSSVDYQVLTLLYQPIIGTTAFNLYLTLLNLMDRQTLVSEEYLHADLESLLNRKIESIEEDRFKLEAIGLLVTFFVSDSFTYEIKLPLSARSFVNDGILGEYLISAITKTRFKKILKVFKIKQTSKKQKYNISKAFNEVFKALDHYEQLQETNLISGQKQRFKSLSEYDFNWRFFEESIPESIFNLDNLTKAIRLKLESLSYVYGLDELTMKDVLLKSLDENSLVNIESLAKNSRYAYENSNHIKVKHTELEKATVRNAPDNPVDYFKTISPIQLLEELGDGMVSVADLRIVERLIDEVGLEPSVVNVMLAYIARAKDGVLPGFAFFQKVGQNWKRNHINTVELAMDFVKHLESRKNTKPYYNKNKPKDIEVDWLEEYINNLD
jgi:replication initiation and membrane attachment protein